MKKPICGVAVLAAAVMAASAAQSAPREKVIYSFAYGADGAAPQGGVIRDAQGNLYGTTQQGAGTGCGGGGCGTVFKLTPAGKETILHVFTGDDGAFPVPGWSPTRPAISMGRRSTAARAASCACGVVFKVTQDGQFSIVHAFSGGADGTHPVAGLIIDKRGDLLGTTGSGGNDCNGTGGGCGTVFKIKPDGRRQVLHAFTGADGIYPASDLSLDASGNIYGTASNGGQRLRRHRPGLRRGLQACARWNGKRALCLRRRKPRRLFDGRRGSWTIRARSTAPPTMAASTATEAAAAAPCTSSPRTAPRPGCTRSPAAATAPIREIPWSWTAPAACTATAVEGGSGERRRRRVRDQAQRQGEDRLRLHRRR